ncbi:hypothetical protein GFM13_26295 [Rhizobium leguminosarum bv. viciae]|nr:hypothetical protein [Rhizobium bangladeshense]NKK73794.1 hypothetical protein [Rhizobium leguminosarum bv. viciae]
MAVDKIPLVIRFNDRIYSQDRSFMTLRWIATLALVLTFAQGCSSYNNKTAQRVPGHTFMTKNDCVRTERADAFDSRCDIPLLGFSGFNGP